MFRSLFLVKNITSERPHSSTHLHNLLSNFLLLGNNQNPKFLHHTKKCSNSSFVVSYLMKSCGLSEEKAKYASKKVHFETSSQPDSVLTLLETNGFTKSHICKIITKVPFLLKSNPLKTLKPKLDFFNSKGLSGVDLANAICREPILLSKSLEKQMIPCFDFLKTILSSDKKVFVALKRSSSVLSRTIIVPKIELLRDEGVPESNIAKLLLTHPRSLTISPARFKENVEKVKEMGFDPLKVTFVLAIIGLSSVNKSTWDAKLNVYRKWGWSENDIQTAFVKQPYCMMTSEKKITAIMDFLVNQMCYDPVSIAQSPVAFSYSLEKTTIPRYRVIRILISKGLIDKNISIYTIITKTEKSFIKRYVIRYEKQIPELLKIYKQGQLESDQN